MARINWAGGEGEQLGIHAKNHANFHFFVVLSQCICHVHVYVAFFNRGKNLNPDREEITLPMKVD
jgi:hypothetical protein